jgi:hypothetical protein
LTYTDNTAKAAYYSKVVYGDSSQFTGDVNVPFKALLYSGSPIPKEL